MTEVILNNLNMFQQQENNFNKNVSLPKDFNKVLDEKTVISKQTSDNENSDNQKTLGDLKNRNIITSISGIIAGTVEEIAGETALEGIITDLAESLPEEISEAIENTSNIINETDENEENTEESTIINEDPTMNKEDLFYPVFQDNTLSIPLQIPQQNLQNQDNEDTDNNLPVINIKQENKDNQNVIKFNINQPKDESIKTINFTGSEKDTPKAESNHKNLLDDKIVNDLNIQTIESESTQNGTSDNLMQNQSPQEQVIKAIINGDIKFDDTAIKNFATVQENARTEISSAKIIEQITKQLDNMYNGSKVNMVLNPEKLGKLSLQIINGKEGLSAMFTVTTNEARNILMKGIDGLRETLLAHGVNVDNINIKLNETEESSYNPDWTEQEGSKGGNKQGHPQKQKDEQKHFEQMMFELNNDDKV